MSPVVRKTLSLRTLALLAVLLVVTMGGRYQPPAAAEQPSRVDGKGKQDDPDAGRSIRASASLEAQKTGGAIEDLSRRTEDTQVFANPDGTWTAEIAPGPVRVQDEDGAWVDIDTDLHRIDGGFAPKATKSGLVIAAGGTKTFASLEIDGRRLAWTWPTTLPTPTIEGDTATYADVVDGGDLVVTALPTGFQHNVVLRERPRGSVSFDFPIVTQGPAVTEAKDGSLSIVTKAGEELVSAPTPVMFDAGGDAGERQRDGGAADDSTVASTQEVPVDVSLEKTPTGSVLTLEPSEEFLNDPATTYPVTIDPIWSSSAPPSDTWISSGDPDGIRPFNETLKIGTPNLGTHKYRSLVSFNKSSMAPWMGQVVSSATLKMRNFHALTCSGVAVEARRVTEPWKPGTVTWNNRPGGTTTGAASSSAAYGFSSACSSADIAWNVTSIAQAWASGAPYYGFLIRAADETRNAGYREFRSADYASTNAGVVPRLSVTFNSYPKTPGAPIATPGSGGFATSLTPTLKAMVSDPDGGAVKGTFVVSAAATGQPVWTGTSAAVASGGTASIAVPAGKLSDGTKYAVKVTANDGGLSSKAVATMSFTVRLPAVSADPVIEQILALSQPGTLEADVVAMINEMVADSNGDGEGALLTFAQAKDELLAALVGEANEAPDDTTEVPVGDFCEWSVKQAGPNVTVAHAGELATLTPAAATTADPAAPVFAGAVDGTPVAVTLWRGTPDDVIATEIAESEDDLAALRAASIGGAVDGEGEGETEEALTDLPQPGALVPVAYRLEAEEVIEHGLPEKSASDVELVSAAVDSTRECVRNDAATDDGAELNTEQGLMTFVGQDDLASGRVAGAAAPTYPTTSSAVRYRTFIPDATANSSWVCGKFKGDNRSYTSYFEASHRTRASVFFNWPQRTIDTTKHVGASHRYKGYGRSEKTKTASSSGIQFRNASIAGYFGRIAIVHSVGNPMCRSAGDAAYNIVVEVWKEGAARISGTRLKAPNHEAYLYPKTEEYGKTIMKKKGKSLICLSLNCGTETLWERTK